MKLRFLAIAMIGSSPTAFGDSESVTSIRAGGLKRPDGVTLTGAGVEIGQVEIGRTAVRPLDTNAVSNGFIIPAESRIFAGQMPAQNQFVDPHALQVAGVMIGKPGAPTSVAPNANLYSTNFGGEIDFELLATQYIAKRFTFSNPQHIRAINHSWVGLPSDGPFDGNSQLTLGMDWIASRFDVLHVSAGAEDGRGKEPTDNYNGITVAALTEEAGGGYLRVAALNDNEDADDAVGERVSVDLLAPGEGLTLATAGASNPTTNVPTGTSFAAPHVTGTVALLNEYSDFQVGQSVPRWDSDNTRKHEVMKAVLLNSADKIDGVHGSTRTILDENGQNWENSPAFFDDAMSLDQQMGAGALNASRALTQFRSGEYNNGENIPKIGWDYGETGGGGTLLSYPFSSAVGGDVAITLAWDRIIVKNGGPDDTFTGSDIFSADPVEDLDLYLVPVGWDDLFSDAVAKSVSGDDSVEHIFKDVPTDNYEIVVTQVFGDEVDFGLAWWIGATIPGDFNNDGNVNGQDLGQWRTNFGTGGGADADGDGDSDGTDFMAWQRNVGTTSATPAVAAVPEPAAWMLATIGLPFLRLRTDASRRYREAVGALSPGLVARGELPWVSGRKGQPTLRELQPGSATPSELRTV